MAIINNTLGFSLKRTIDNITVTNLSVETNNTLSATLFLQQNCNNNSFKQISQSFKVEDLITFNIPKQDGTYKIRLTFTDINEGFIYKEYLFTSYKNLLADIIKDSKKFICELNCSNCKEEDLNLLQSTLTLNMLSYYILNKNYYSKFFNLGLDCIKCNLLDILNCNRVGVSFYGTKEDTEVYKKTIGFLYLIFYFGEKYTYSCCPEEVNNFFKFDEIFKCLQKHNLDIACIETKIISDPNFSISNNNFIEII